MKASVLLLLLLASFTSGAQNMIVNPGAESVVGAPWQNGASPNDPTCSNTSNWRRNPLPTSQTRSGSYIFFPGCNTTSTGGTYELYQDVSIAANAVAVDGGRGLYTFAGWYSNWNQGSPDQCAFRLDFLDGTSAPIGTVSSGFLTSATNTSGTPGAWIRSVQTFTVPALTRTIRVRMLAKHNSGSAIDSYFDDLSLTTGPSPLPVSLGALTAVHSPAGVQLSWADYQPAGQQHYMVDWSTDGRSWTSVGQVLPVSDGRMIFKHANPSAGTNYYRIAALGKSNVLTYTNIASVEAVRQQVSLLVSPVPAKGPVRVDWNGPQTSARLFSLQGQLVRSLTLYTGTNPFDISGLPAGCYVLRVDGEAPAVQRVFVQQD